MIVFLLGGHGSGKSTAVRKILPMPPMLWGPLRRPAGYVGEKVFVLGHYELVNGGADTVRPLSVLADIVGHYARDRHVVMEGIGQAGILDHVLPLMRQHGGCGLWLRTSLNSCVASVHARGHVLSEDGIRRGWVRAENMAEKMRVAGFRVDTVTRNNVVGKLKELIR